MRLVSYAGSDGVRHAGALTGPPPTGADAEDQAPPPGGIVPLSALGPGVPDDVLGVLAGGPPLIRQLAAELPHHEASVSLAQVTLSAPVPHPGKIIAIGLNYRDHAAETGDPIPDYPVVFAKFPSSATGPYADVVYPALSHRLDYEAELGVVIGKHCRGVSVDEALSVVAGYLVVNDVSARDVQNQTSQWTLGKSFDTFAPMGPALVTADEIPDPQNLDIWCLVNDELRQSSNTSNMIFSVARLIADLSAVCTLEPGDVIATGTPGGVGIGHRPEALLSVGDRVTVHIAGLGSISNRIVAPEPAR